MRQLLVSICLIFGILLGQAQDKSLKKSAVITLEDLFRFENVGQLTDFFGRENVFTETTFYQKPEDGGKPYLQSQINFGTPKAVLAIWTGDGKTLCGVQVSAFYYNYKTQKLNLIPNEWNTRQRLHAGMKLSDVIRVNWFALSFETHKGKLNYGHLIPGFGWLKKETKVSFLPQKLFYEYTLDLKKINEYFPKGDKLMLKSNDKTVRKWNPMLEMISIYRVGMKPQN
jgi:hypothetical protein